MKLCNSQRTPALEDGVLSILVQMQPAMASSTGKIISVSTTRHTVNTEPWNEMDISRNENSLIGRFGIRENWVGLGSPVISECIPLIMINIISISGGNNTYIYIYINNGIKMKKKDVYNALR